jgi:tRNA pseudouridine38-40 synthase
VPRYLVTLEYDGTPFVGWQVQAEGASVQGCLIDAIFKASGEKVRVRGAGRTDAGVHAMGQVAHFDLEKSWRPDKLRDALNFHLKPNPIAVLEAQEVPATFDARFSAVERRYLYRLLPRRAPPVIERDRVWWVARPLDVEAMQKAAAHLVGHNDFTTFRAAGCQSKSPVKTLDVFRVVQQDMEVHIHAAARSFMHNQVRSMVGSLKLVGDGKWTPDDMRLALEARDRTRCGPVAPPWGLYFAAVRYPDDAYSGAVAPHVDDFEDETAG